MTRLNILQINKYYAPHIGGVEHVVQSLCEGLKAHVGVRALVCNKKGGTTRDVIGGVEVVRSSSWGQVFSMPISFRFIPLLRKLSREADILHFHMPFPLGDLAYLLSGYKGKVVVHWHSDIVRQKRLLKLYKPLMNAFLRRVDRIITATQGHIDGSEQLASYREKCAVVPYGIDAENYVKNAAPYRVLPSEQKGMADILFVGRLVHYKGVEVLLNALAQVKNAKLTLVGDGPLRHELAEMADRLDISERVQFLGQISNAEVKACFRDCDVFVLPSIQNNEAFGMVQLQAMCYAKPVVNTALNTGVPLVSVHGQHGLTAVPGDAMSLADALYRLVDDRDYAQKLGENGCVRVRETFGMNDMIDGVLAQYRQLVN